MLNVLSLATGIGGLELAVSRAVLQDVNLVAVADPDKNAAKVLAQRFPGTRNLGDITALNWEEVVLPRLDMITAGFPCQPFSHAGNRQAEKDPRHIWPEIRDAIDHYSPGHVFVENVIGFRKLGLPTVKEDLERMGYRVNWSVFTAAEVGMPHQRKRVYLHARQPWAKSLLIDEDAHLEQPAELGEEDELWPTPTPFTLANRENPEEWQDRWSDVLQRTGTKHGLPLSVALRAMEESAHISQRNKGGQRLLDMEKTGGPYQKALEHWAEVFGQAMPIDWHPLVIPNHKRPGDTFANPLVVEWLMSFPSGWVSDVEGVTIQNKNKLLGNAVAPYQGAMALASLVDGRDRA